MCTVTIIPFGSGAVRMACNRDELHSRPPALPPQVRRFGERQAVLPIDPVSQGTWVATSDAGLAVTVLNVNVPEDGGREAIPSAAAAGSVKSRGLIIPALLHCGTLEEATRLAARMALEDYAPFRLVLVDRQEVVEVLSLGRLPVVHRTPLTYRRLFTSSSLGDHLVEGPRRELFNTSFGRRNDWPRQQDAFHRHCWPDRPHLSVCMSRADARTVSYTVVELCERSVRMTYSPDSPNQPSWPVSVSLDLQQVGAA